MREEGLFQAKRVTFQRARVPRTLLVHHVKKTHIFFIMKEMVGRESERVLSKPRRAQLWSFGDCLVGYYLCKYPREDSTDGFRRVLVGNASLLSPLIGVCSAATEVRTRNEYPREDSNL
jgi:hypothetical protein